MQFANNSRKQISNNGIHVFTRNISFTASLEVAKRDFYAVLKVPRNALQCEIKDSFNQLAKVYQVQIASGSEEANKRLQQITEAYEVLSNVHKRRLYDKGGFLLHLLHTFSSINVRY